MAFGTSGGFQKTRDNMSGYTDVARIRQARWVEDDEGGMPTLVLDILPTILQGENDAATEDELFYGVAGLISFPKPATSDTEAAEAIFVDAGSRLVVGTRDLRFEIEPLEGETIIHALGKDGTRQAHVKLTADGKAIVSADEVLIGVATASEGIGLGDAIKGHLDALKSAYDTHIHPDPASGNTGAPTVASPVVPTVASASHKVEP